MGQKVNIVCTIIVKWPVAELKVIGLTTGLFELCFSFFCSVSYASSKKISKLMTMLFVLWIS